MDRKLSKHVKRFLSSNNVEKDNQIQDMGELMVDGLMVDGNGDSMNVISTTFTAFPQISLASFLCSVSIIEYTIPQIVRLSQSSSKPLQPIWLKARFALLTKSIVPQTAITILQFGLVRELRDVLDNTIGPSRYNISLAYGVASVPFIAGKYNLIQETVFNHGITAATNTTTTSTTTPVSTANQSFQNTIKSIWTKKIQPGLLWSYLRDSGSIGGGIVLGPIVTSTILQYVENGKDGKNIQTKPQPYQKFGGGLIAGCCTGLLTQLFHNTALTAGRIAEVENRTPTTMECLNRCIKEHGVRALYMNFRYRVAIIATWTAILNVTEPFSK